MFIGREVLMIRKINKSYIEQYKKITMIQPLAHNREVLQIALRRDNGWFVKFSTNSPHHICPYDGVFRNCKDCGALDDKFDIKICLNKLQILSSAALCRRINDCFKAGLEVKFEE